MAGWLAGDTRRPAPRGHAAHQQRRGEGRGEISKYYILYLGGRAITTTFPPSCQETEKKISKRNLQLRPFCVTTWSFCGKTTFCHYLIKTCPPPPLHRAGHCPLITPGLGTSKMNPGPELTHRQFPRQNIVMAPAGPRSPRLAPPLRGGTSKKNNYRELILHYHPF